MKKDMSFIGLVKRKYAFVKQGGWPKFFSLLGRAARFMLGLIPAFLFLLLMRLIRPLLLIRLNRLLAQRIGHLAANTENYVNEIRAGVNVPRQRYMDISFLGGSRIANKQFAKMWKRVIRIWPRWFMEPLFYLNNLIPGGTVHLAENEITEFQFGRDVNGFMARTPANLSFTEDEIKKGCVGLRKIGIPEGAKYVCLIVRDSAYLNAVLPHPEQWSYHKHRDSDIQTYVMAAEALAARGIYVLRMGEVVNSPINTMEPKIIDYASNGMRTDFMDIYLGATCYFCITVGTGFDGVPMVFRRPMVFVNAVPFGTLSTFIANSIHLVKKYWSISKNRHLSFTEILANNVGHIDYYHEYAEKDIKLIDNSPEEITDAALEMVSRLEGTWHVTDEDLRLQKRFWESYPLSGLNGANMRHHGAVHALYSAQFLRDHKDWLV